MPCKISGTERRLMRAPLDAIGGQPLDEATGAPVHRSMLIEKLRDRPEHVVVLRRTGDGRGGEI